MTSIPRTLVAPWPRATLPIEIALSTTLAAIVGAATMLAVALGVPEATAIVASRVPVAANTGICFILLALSLRGAHAGARWAAVPAFLVSAIAGLTLAEFVTNWEIGVDRWLLGAPPGASEMSPQTAMAMVLLSVSLAAGGTRVARPLSRVAATLVLLVAVVNLLDVIFRAEIPTVLAPYTQMAVPTAVTFIALSIGIVALQPSGTILELARDRGPAGTLLRRMVVAAIVIPIVVDWLRLAGERQGWYEAGYGVALTTLAVIILFVAVIRMTARTIQRSEAARELAESERERARAEAERANRAKGEFLSRMSHELRTPLNSVLGFAQLLEADDLAPEQRESAAYIRRAGRHLLDLINEVLDIARIDTGTLTISVEAVAVDECLDEVTSFILPLAAARQIKVEPREVCEGYVLADRQRLRQILLNLLSNAVKYNRQGGSISVTCHELGARHLRIDVTDTGEGIPAGSIGRLFEPFDRLGAERTEIEGAGMGLALSKALAEAMGGEIGVQSEPGVGSTFWVAFRLAAAPDEPPEEVTPRAAAPTSAVEREILYIEDNPANLRLVERVFARLPGIRLVAAIQGQLGLDLARERSPSLVLLDLHLPDMDGSEVLRELRAHPSTTHIPVVILTADGSEGRASVLLAAGADAYLTKPLDVAQLTATVARLLPAAVEAPSR